MKLSRFIVDARMKGGTPVPDELDPMPLFITRIRVSRYSAESQAFLRTCLAAVDAEREMYAPDLWALGNDARGLLNAKRRLEGKYC